MKCSASGTLQRSAMADTVTGLSPEITFGRTFCWMKYSMVSAASGRTSSLNSTSASALRSGGRVPAGGMEAELARSRTRRPSDASCCTRCCSGWSPGSRISGAPTYQAPCPSKATAEYLWVESNGMRPLVDQPGEVPYARWIAFMVAFGYSSAAARAASAASRSVPLPAEVSGSTFSRLTSPVVRVPVLSEASTVTRASVSTAWSCWTSTCL